MKLQFKSALKLAAANLFKRTLCKFLSGKLPTVLFTSEEPFAFPEDDSNQVAKPSDHPLEDGLWSRF